MTTFSFSDEPQTLRVFNYAPDTQEFIGASDCYIAPNTGLPGNCTLSEPPETKAGKTAVWGDDGWQLVEDHRGLVVYDKENGGEITICSLGALPKDVTVIKPASQFDRWNGKDWQPDIADAKAAHIAAIKRLRDELTADYIIIDGHHFHSDSASRIQQITLTKMGQAKQIPQGLMWQSKNHGLIPLTSDIAAQFEKATLEHDMRLFATAQRHITAVEALKEVQAVIGYDYSQGWQR